MPLYLYIRIRVNRQFFFFLVKIAIKYNNFIFMLKLQFLGFNYQKHYILLNIYEIMAHSHMQGA